MDVLVAEQRGKGTPISPVAYAGWLLLAALAAALPPQVEPLACALMAGVGLLAVAPRGLRPLAMLAAVGAVVVEPELIPWLLAAAFAQLALEARASRRIGPPALDSDLQRALMRGRRRDEEVAALVATTDEPPGEGIIEVLDLLRVTDSYEVEATERHWELRAVFEGEGLQREAVERRLSAAVHGMRFGWAEFPREGATLEVLLEEARHDLDRRSSFPVLSGAP
jgi:hypothetical protein